MPYRASPSIPPGMSPKEWDRVVNAAAREAARLTRTIAAGGDLPKDVQTRALMVRGLMGALEGISGNAALAADYVMATHYGPLLSASSQALGAAMEGHALAAGEDLAGWLTSHGWTTVPNEKALQAVAARTTQAMLHDWERLTAGTRRGVADAVLRGMVEGINPREAARLVQAAMVESGGASFGRALNIARTEMADCYDASVMDTIGGVDGVMYRYEAQPDACPVCQVLHGLVFPADEYPDRHHQCRCVIVPVLPGEGEPGEYLEGEQRPRGATTSQLPKSWEVPDDLRDLLGKRANEGWRPSWTMVKP